MDLGQTLGVAVAALVFDRFSAVPLFLATAAVLPLLGWWFAVRLRRRGFLVAMDLVRAAVVLLLLGEPPKGRKGRDN